MWQFSRSKLKKKGGGGNNLLILEMIKFDDLRAILQRFLELTKLKILMESGLVHFLKI